MDELSAELQDYLIRLGKEGTLQGGKMEHYTHHLLHLLPHESEDMLTQYYGLFGNEVKTPDEIAYRNNMPVDALMQAISISLRRLAVTPEWQMMKQLINSHNS